MTEPKKEIEHGNYIHFAISQIMKDIGPISKDNENKFQHYKFRGIDDVYKAVNPILVKHGVYCTPDVEEVIREENKTKDGKAIYYTIVRVRYTFYAEDGSNVSASVVGEGMDSSDKSANKAMSAAFKMVFFQVFCIPTEEGSVDSEKDSHEPKGKAAGTKKKGTTTNFEFLDVMGGMKKKVGEANYYAVLKLYKVEHANELIKRADQTKVFKKLQEVEKELGGGE